MLIRLNFSQPSNIRWEKSHPHRRILGLVDDFGPNQRVAPRKLPNETGWRNVLFVIEEVTVTASVGRPQGFCNLLIPLSQNFGERRKLLQNLFLTQRRSRHLKKGTYRRSVEGGFLPPEALKDLAFLQFPVANSSHFLPRKRPWTITENPRKLSIGDAQQRSETLPWK
jgi:hypothetical protein